MPVDIDLTRWLKISNELEEAISEGLQEAGDMIKDLASELAPKDTGDLSESGKVEVIDSHTVEISFGNDLPDARAIYQEYGTDLPAQPYLTPAARAINVTVEVSKALKKRL